MKRIRRILVVIVVSMLGSGWMHVYAGDSNAAVCENEALRLAAEDGVEAGLTAIRKCLVQSPKRAKSYVVYGDLLLKVGDDTGADKAFDEALALRPTSAAAKTGKGMVLFRQGKLDEAATVLTEALQLNPEPSFTHYQLGQIYEQQGKLADALLQYKEGITVYEQHRK